MMMMMMMMRRSSLLASRRHLVTLSVPIKASLASLASPASPASPASLHSQHRILSRATMMTMTEKQPVMSVFRDQMLATAFDVLTTNDQDERKAIDVIIETDAVTADLSSRDAFVKSLKTVLGDLPVERFVAVVGERIMPAGTYQNSLRFDMTPLAIKGLAEEIKARTLAVSDAVVAVPHAERTWENTLQPLAELDVVLSGIESSLDFMHSVSADKAVRDASRDAEKEMREFYVTQRMRVDMYDAITAFSEINSNNNNNDGDGDGDGDGKKNHDRDPALSGERKRLLDDMLLDFRRCGLHLSADKRSRIEAIDKELSALGIEFSNNLSEEKIVLEFTREELDGVPDSVVSTLPKSESDGSKLSLELSYVTYFPSMRFCKVEATRRRLERAFSSRCLETNPPLLEKMISLRAERAGVLGYATHAHYVLEKRMAKNPDAVQAFLESLSVKLHPLAKKEMDDILALKKKEKEENSEVFDGKIHMWDLRYYMRMREEQQFQVDRQALRPYFPLQIVTDGMLGIYSELMSLRFEKVPADKAHVWHPDVQMFNVFDKDDDTKLLGQFYLDLFPREGKYSHAACFPLQPGARIKATADEAKAADFPRQVAVSAMVCNFTKPTADKPSLLGHDEVVTYFHEFGHAVHGLCSQTQLAHFSGTRVERDFVEAPSQMLENWCWEKESLLRMCGHVDDPERKVPDEMLSKLSSAKCANAGLLNLRQVVFASFDMDIHSSKDPVDTAAVFAKHLKNVLGIDSTPGTNWTAGFGHMAGGYDASYYGYLWSEVFSADMFFSVFKKSGIMSAEAGLAYRSKILSRGGSVDGMDMLEDFLGRKPTQDAFLRSLGLRESSE